MAEKILVTEEELEGLKKKLYKLENVDIVELQKRVADAAAEGDLSENAAYETAKEDLDVCVETISNVSSAIQNAEIIQYNPNLKKIQIGDRVELVNTNGDKYVFTITGNAPMSGNPRNGVLSINSPVGSALLNRALKGTISVLIDADVIEYSYTRLSRQ